MSPRAKHRAPEGRQPKPAAVPDERSAEFIKLAYAASHDLNAPLRKIVTFGDLLKERLKDKADSVDLDYLERIRNSAADASQIVSDLMTLSRIAHENFSFERVDMNAVLAAVKAELAPEIAASGAVIEAGRLPVLKGHVTLLHALLLNLLSNAVKFRRPDQRPRVRVDSRRDGENLELTVADNGIGFDPSYAETIFRPFMRLNAPSVYKGNGLGLAVARAVARRFGGTLTAANSPDGGAIFTLRLPAGTLAD